MFDPSPDPRVFALPLGVDFAGRFVDGLLARLEGQPPEALARVVIYTNTRRSARRVEDILCADGARLLPDIRVITDLSGDPGADLPAAIPPLRRRLILARLVAAYVEQQPDVAPESAVFDLASSLGTLLDSFQGEGVALEALHTIDTGHQSAHWQRSLRFLEILGDYWGNHRPENAPDPEERQRAVAEGYARLWQIAPPAHPVIVAGSTGSRGATALFMQAVAKLPQGAVVLPGYDYDMPDAAWEEVRADHPQYGFRALRKRIGFTTPPLWHGAPPAAPARNRLVSLALRPAPVTDQWLSEGPPLAPDLAQACTGMTLLEAPSPQAEAGAIAIRLRLAAEAGQRAALVSPDRMLTRRVTAALARWHIEPDDSAGHPLPLTPPGIFLRRIAALAARPLTPLDLLVLLKHPLCGGGGEARARHLDWTRQLEMQVLRGGPPVVDWAALAVWADGDAGQQAWVANLRRTLAPLAQTPESLPLADWLALHRETADALSAGGGETAPLWEKEAGKAAAATFDALEQEAPFGSTITAVQYRALFQSVLSQSEVREEAFLPHPGIAILGTLEARVQTADLVILGGLNEGVWPAMPDPDPWMSRDMRARIGLPLPERQTGLSAHDFQQAIAAQEVVLSRAIRDGESPTVASRWLIRLENLLEGLKPEGVTALASMRARGAELLALETALETPEKTVPAAPRPSPAPPVAARPDQLSVTRIETLIRDPYAIYADRILRLRALDPPGREADALTRGTVLHRVLELFVEQTMEGLPEDAETLFLDISQRVLEQEVPWPAARHLWLARLRRIAPWFVETEQQRRQQGHPLGLEVTGKRRMLSPRFTLTAKADRIDAAPNGALNIYDYKSGKLDSLKKIKPFAVQLPLEGAIAQDGGFESIAPSKIGRLELIGLNGQQTLDLGFEDAEIAEFWDRLQELVTAYADPAQGYTARPRPERLSYASDYDHLSRYGEWQDGDPFTPEDLT